MFSQEYYREKMLKAIQQAEYAHLESDKTFYSAISQRWAALLVHDESPSVASTAILIRGETPAFAAERLSETRQ